MVLDQQWSLIKKRICRVLKQEDCEGWLDALNLVSVSPGKAVITGVPHRAFLYDIKKNYDPLFRQLLGEIFPENAPFEKKKVEYRIGGQQSSKNLPVQEEFSFGQLSSQVNATDAPKQEKSSKSFSTEKGREYF